MNRALTIKEIASAMLACRANAHELHDESEILEKSGHQARAFALLHMAIEELAKFFILELAGKQVAQKNPPNWARFWKRLRAHDSKIAQAHLRIFEAVLKINNDNDYAYAMVGAEMLFKAGLTPRNTSLYVDLSPEGNFRQPSEIDWGVGIEALRYLVISLFKMADAAGPLSDAIEKMLSHPLQAEDQAHIRVLFAAVIERSRQAGMSEEQLRTIIDRSYTRS